MSFSLDAEALYADLLREVQRLIKAYATPPQLVGVTSGGVWLVERLQSDLGLNQPVSMLSSSMHRDDFSKRGMATSGQTVLPFDVNDAHIVLLDDVLYTGRTVRAVLNELFDYGRPASVKLVVLVDRQGRELPIEASFAASKITLPADQSLALARSGQGQFHFQVTKA